MQKPKKHTKSLSKNILNSTMAVVPSLIIIQNNNGHCWKHAKLSKLSSKTCTNLESFFVVL